MKSDELMELASMEGAEVVDADLRNLSREQVLTLEARLRMRWFYLLQVTHAELKRVTDDLEELLMPDNETKIISVIGMTGIGKTTLANSLMRILTMRYGEGAHASEVPVIYVRAPANGERRLCWSGLYRRILEAGGEFMLHKKRAAKVTDGERMLNKGRSVSVSNLRDLLEAMLVNRNVKVLIIDEALHLLRFDDHATIMDTLKSLADIHSTKLMLIGSYDIAGLMTEYGQVARRSEIVHYRRYLLGDVNREALTDEQKEFLEQVKKFQLWWPCETAPNLVDVWDRLMEVSMGSIGLLKVTLLRIASLQMSAEGERLTAALIKKAFKAPKARQKIEQETIKGEETLKGACYGDNPFGDDEKLESVCNLLMAA